MREGEAFDTQRGCFRVARQVAIHWAEGEVEQAEALLAEGNLPQELQAVRTLLRARMGASLLQSTVADLETLTRAIAHPPKEPNLFAVLLVNACTKQLALIQPEKARHYLDALGREDESRLDPVVRFWCETGRAMYAAAVDDIEMKHRSEAAMLAARMPRTSQGWCAARFTNLRSAIDRHDHSLTEQLFQELESQREIVDRFRFGEHALAQLRLYWHFRCGRLTEAMAIHDALPEEPVDHNWTNTRTRALLLIRAGQLQRAQGLIARLNRLVNAHTMVPRPGALMGLAGAYALATQDAAGAARLARQALAAGPEANDARTCRRLLAGAELALGHPRAARLALGTPAVEFPEDAVLRARAALADGSDLEAVRLMAPVVARCGLAFLGAELAYATELSAARLAGVLAACGEQRRLPVQAVAIEPAPVIAASLIGQSDAMKALRRTLKRFAEVDAPVLLQGETGTGKEIAAGLLHALSQRREQPFLAVDCGAVSESLVESELFGHVQGAFTGATRVHEGLLLAAGAGTMFLDEINSMGPRLQASLLRVLESGEVRAVGGTRSRQLKARLVLASNRPLAEEVAAGRFRADLYYRIERLVVALPPLRERLEDIPALVEHFILHLRGHRVPLGAGLLRWLQERPWPGNVRELRNCIERLVLLSGERAELDESCLPEAPAATLRPPADRSAQAEAQTRGGGPHRPRLERLRELFVVHRSLTRAEVVRHLRCAPNTASSALRTLMDEGFIHRVETSANLRTSFFSMGRQEGRGELR